MPIYEYACQKCGAHTEILQKITDKPPAKCQKCGGKLEKQWSQTSFQLKGSGWYVTDYARQGAASKEGKEGKEDKSETADKANGAGDASATATGGETKAAETKSDAPKEKSTKKKSPSASSGKD